MEVAMSTNQVNERCEFTDTNTCYTSTDWHDRYAIGIPVVDSRYQHLFFLFNTTNDGFIKYASTNDLNTTFDQLIDYAQYQFFAEERWMQYHLFPGLAKHEKEHRKMLAKVSNIYTEFHSGTWPLSIEILEVIHLWLRSHILLSDEDIQDFIAAKRQSDSLRSCAFKKKTFDTARMALHAWHNYYNQTTFGLATSPKYADKFSCNSGGLSC
jgi:hemerythrin